MQDIEKVTMANKLFIGGLAWATTDESLQAAFSQVGTVVSATVVKDHATGRSKGFGFVEFSTDAEAEAAIAQLDGKEVDGRAIRVSAAQPREDRGPRPAGGSTGGFRRGGFDR